MGLTTVYRTLSGLVAAGEVDVLRTDQGEAIYRRCARDDHHHHLVCRHCGQSVEIGDPQIESWTAATAQRHGFVETSHAVEVFGRCRGCAESR